MELQLILLQNFMMKITFPTLNFTNSWKYFDLSIITSHVSPITSHVSPTLYLPYQERILHSLDSKPPPKSKPHESKPPVYNVFLMDKPSDETPFLK